MDTRITATAEERLELAAANSLDLDIFPHCQQIHINGGCGDEESSSIWITIAQAEHLLQRLPETIKIAKEQFAPPSEPA
jgi:hypothetical protein